MTEYIERDKVLAEEEFFGEHATWDNPMADGCMAVRSDFIMSIPAADVIPVRHGRWIAAEDGDVGDTRCSLCGCYHHVWEAYGYYCQHCGARMDGQ